MEDGAPGIEGREGDNRGLMRVYVVNELVRSPNPYKITPSFIGSCDAIHQGKMCWREIQRLIQESIDRAEPGREEKIKILRRGELWTLAVSEGIRRVH